MLIKSMSEEVIHLRRTAAVSNDGLRKVSLSEIGKLKGAFVQKSLTHKENAGAYIPVTRYTFTVSGNDGGTELSYGDILKRRDGSMVRVISKKSSSPKIAGSLMKIDQYLTEEVDYDGRAGNI